ncbi:Paternally-expressed gene 3 protein [Anabarilius grahami]|uniref:Paternally-expressed gene 3 protein n=1 Tax=Anabarilius grahami TaxID=495550 RepID=A0A3N0XQY0_ANAGA|nr:Paternally-expressed gene 3 protein [Anabarilius grahami]
MFSAVAGPSPAPVADESGGGVGGSGINSVSEEETQEERNRDEGVRVEPAAPKRTHWLTGRSGLTGSLAGADSLAHWLTGRSGLTGSLAHWPERTHWLTGRSGLTGSLAGADSLAHWPERTHWLERALGRPPGPEGWKPSSSSSSSFFVWEAETQCPPPLWPLERIHGQEQNHKFEQTDGLERALEGTDGLEGVLEPLTPTSVAERLASLFQVGRSLERYVEEFVELVFLTNWSDARLNALFLDGLDVDTIRFDEPEDSFSLSETINLILYLNGSDFFVEEVQDVCPSRPVPPETQVARPVGQSPSSSACPSSGLLSCSTLDPHSSAGSRKRRRRKKVVPASEFTPEPALAISEPAALAISEPAALALSEPATSVLSEPIAPVSTEPAPVPVGILIIYEGMDWTPLPAAPAAAEPSAPVAANESAPVAANESAPVAANEPASPVSAAEPASPVSAAEPAAPVSAAEPASPVSAAEPASPVSAAEPASPVSAAEPASPVSAAEPASPVSAAEPASPVSAAEPASPVSAAEPASPVSGLLHRTSRSMRRQASSMLLRP